MNANLPILYTRYRSPKREGSHFIREHVLIYMISGTLIINDGKKVHSFKAGDVVFLQRDHLAKFKQELGAEGDFSSVSIYFNQGLLQQTSEEYGFDIEKHADHHVLPPIEVNPMLKEYLGSLAAEIVGESDPELLKLKKVLSLLLESNPDLKNILFDFSAPGKRDLKAFMEHNYHFMVSLDSFAYLTGRSPAAFKRDFIYLFHISPERWIQHRRLQKAYQLIKEQGEMPADVYQEVGFESLSHFSSSFKRLFGVNPSGI